MKDVAALCKRVVVINDGQIQYDGSLDGIIDQFSSHKVVTLQLAKDDSVDGMEQYGQVLEVQLPKVKLRIERAAISKALASILDRFVIEDVAVEEPPLEEVIAEVFSRGDKDADQDDSSEKVLAKNE